MPFKDCIKSFIKQYSIPYSYNLYFHYKDKKLSLVKEDFYPF